MSGESNRVSLSAASKLQDDLPAPEPDKATAELTVVIDELLNSLSDKFSTISSDLLSRMDEMSRRLDSLEATILSSQKGGAQK